MARQTCSLCGVEFEGVVGIQSAITKEWFCPEHRGQHIDWFENASVPDMLRHMVAQIDEFEEDSPTQTLWIQNHLRTVIDKNLDIVLHMSTEELIEGAVGLEGSPK